MYFQAEAHLYDILSNIKLLVIKTNHWHAERCNVIEAHYYKKPSPAFQNRESFSDA